MVESHEDEPAMSAAELREDERALASGQALSKHEWHPDPQSWAPAGLFNGMVAPAIDFTIKGVLWYQGETDSSAMRGPMYERTFPAMINDWRTRWAEGNFPFLFVQISSFTSTPAETWGVIREAQRRTLMLTDTAMAVSLDVGQADNVHPPDKQTVAARLALAARGLVYGEPVTYSGPVFREATAELENDGTEAIRVWFDHGQGLTYRGRPASGFEVAGEDHRFVAAQAEVEGDTVRVTAASLKHPVYVRYGWAGVVTDSFYNGAGLPASTFTSEPNPVH